MATNRFLITGALGCIGAWAVRNLVREGVPTVVFDLGHDQDRLKLILTPEELARVTFVHGDITDLAAVEQALDEHAITHVIHLAALQLPFRSSRPTHRSVRRSTSSRRLRDAKSGLTASPMPHRSRSTTLPTPVSPGL